VIVNYFRNSELQKVAQAYPKTFVITGTGMVRRELTSSRCRLRAKDDAGRFKIFLQNHFINIRSLLNAKNTAKVEEEVL
jgi:hypothetical protein